MRHWGRHRTRSKVTLLLCINLVALLAGKYTTFITTVTSDWFGESLALAKAPKKKPAKAHLRRPPRSPAATSSRTPQEAQAPDKRRPPVGHWHVIRRGETLSDIAAFYGLRVEVLRQANRLPYTSYVMVGESLRIPSAADSRELVALPRSVQSSERSLFLGMQRHVERRAQTPVKAHQHLLWPVEGLLTSPFGERDHVMGGGGTKFHAGVDLSVPTGTPVQAAQDGIVLLAGVNGAYGKVIKLEHAHGVTTLYAHNSRLLVHVGQHVKAGQVISLSGSTGRSTGPHVHFEVHKDGLPVDPLSYLE
jgi:murein DD-endopeptidase MepM/ murein hydrolase activator NlpD